MVNLAKMLSALVVLAALGIMPARAEIPIATAGPMTGQYLSIGEQFRWGAEVAVADLNAAGGVLGEPVRLIIGDDACDPKQAVAVAQKLVNDGTVFVAGHYCSGSSLPASAVYEDAGVLMISPGSTNPELTDNDGANVFCMCGRDDAQGAVAGTYLAEHWGDKKIAILRDQTAYGDGLAAETRKELNRRGVHETMYAAYEAALILRQSHDMGYAVQLVGGDSIVTDDFWAITGPVGEGAFDTNGDVTSTSFVWHVWHQGKYVLMK
jgi:branched-chain amino acid transport system substrate-binding protein